MKITIKHKRRIIAVVHSEDEARSFIKEYKKQMGGGKRMRIIAQFELFDD